MAGASESQGAGSQELGWMAVASESQGTGGVGACGRGGMTEGARDCQGADRRAAAVGAERTMRETGLIT